MTDLRDILRAAVARHNAGQLTGAAGLYRLALAHEPGQPDALRLTGVLEQGRGDLPAACRWLARAVAAGDSIAPAVLGAALHGAGRVAEAADLYAALARAAPGHPYHPVNAAILLRLTGRPDEALGFCRCALAGDPAMEPAVSGLADILADRWRMAEAARWCRRALILDPAAPAGHEAAARIAERQDDHDRAAAAWGRRLALTPQDHLALFNHALMLEQGGRTAAALPVYRRVRRLAPDFAPAWEKALLDLDLCQWRDHGATVSALLETVRAGTAVPPLLNLAWVAAAPADLLLCARAHIRRSGYAPPDQTPPPAMNRPRLTIGYVSGDFRDHAVAYLAAELFELHDRNRFRVLGYSAWPDPDDGPMRRRLLAGFDDFIDISRLSAADADARMRADGVDILVDLSGHTRHHRLEVFARRPAPVQLTWLGFPGSTGADFFDGILVDSVVAPPEDQAFFSEPLIRLSGCYQVNDRRRAAEGDAPSRAACGLPENGFVFACFNHAPKITPDMFSLWMDLLRQTPGAVLWLLDGPAAMTGNLRREAAAGGVDPGRLVFAPRWPMPRHLTRYRLADLFIDTFPYTAHTTASDSLWAGCPVATRAGDTFASRVAASLLIHMGLPELVARSAAEYQALVLGLAHDPARLAAVRAAVRANRDRAGGPFDTPGFVCNLEDVCLRLWRGKVAAEI